MIENNLNQTVATSDDRVTLYIDVMKVNDKLKHEALVEIGHWLGTQGIQYEIDGAKSFYQNNWLAVRLLADDAAPFKIRFPIVPDSEVQKYHDRADFWASLTTSTQPGMTSFVVPSMQAAGLSGQSFSIKVGGSTP